MVWVLGFLEFNLGDLRCNLMGSRIKSGAGKKYNWKSFEIGYFLLKFPSEIGIERCTSKAWRAFEVEGQTHHLSFAFISATDCLR